MAKMRETRFTVVVPLYNHEGYIEDALKSVFSQTLSPYEIVVIDDGSSDKSYERAAAVLKRQARGTIERQPNAGAHAAINRAIEQSSGEFIAVLNSDDRFMPHKLERCAAIFAERPSTDLVFGAVNLIDSHGKLVREGETVDWLKRSLAFLDIAGRLDLALLHEQFAVTTSNMVFRRELFRKNGGFKPLRYCHDLEFLLETFRTGAIIFDRNNIHVDYRLHVKNTIKENPAGIRVEIAAVLAAAMHGGVLRAETDTMSRRLLGLLDRIITDKNLGNLLPILMSRRSLFDSKEAFYAFAIENEHNSSALTQLLEGKVRMEDEPTVVVKAPNVAVDQRRPNLMDGPIVMELQAFDRGGLEKVVLDSSVLLRRRGVETIIVSCAPVGHLGSVAREHGLTVYELPQNDRENFYAALLHRHKVKLAVSHFSRTGYQVFARLSIPNITFVHNVYAMLHGESLDAFRSDDSFVTAYISVSANATRYATGRLGIGADKITTVPNGLDIEEHMKLSENPKSVNRAQFGLADDDYVFLNAASYNLHKGHYLMADAMRLVLKKRRDLKILCVGNVIVPHHVETFQDFLKREALDEHILMPGYFKDISELHAISNAFLLPSFIEGWSIAMNEAMFYGKPMILTDTGASREVIADSDIGKLIPNEYGDILSLDCLLLDDIAYRQRTFRTAAYLAQAMIEFASNPQHWQVAGAKGREKIIANYSFSTMIDRYIDVMESVLSQTRMS